METKHSNNAEQELTRDWPLPPFREIQSPIYSNELRVCEFVIVPCRASIDVGLTSNQKQNTNTLMMMEQEEDTTLTSTSKEGEDVVVVQEDCVAGSSATTTTLEEAVVGNKEDSYATEEQMRAVFSNGIVS